MGALDSTSNLLDGTLLDGLAITPVPEPAALALLATGLLATLALRRRQRRS